MRIWTSEHVYNHPWETVTQAVWRKYPNPHKPEVLGTDVVERKVIDGILHSQRLISSRWGLPGWAQKFLGSDKVCYGYEHSEVDPIRRIMTMRSTNVTLASSVSFDEKMVYEQDPREQEKTIVRQETLVTVHGVPLSSFIENYLFNTASRNSLQGREAMEWVINKINVEVEQLITTYKRSTTELISSFGEITEKTIKSVDGFSDKAKKSIDDLSLVTKRSIGDISSVTKKGLDEIHSLSGQDVPVTSS